MSKYIELAKKLRADKEVHYNCAQAVILSYVDTNIDHDMLFQIFSNYGKGLRCGNLCGALSGAMTVLGYYGVNDIDVLDDFYERVKERYDNAITCDALLAKNPHPELGNHPYCDSLIYTAMEILEEVLLEQKVFHKEDIE